MNIFTEIKLGLEVRKTMKTLLQNGYKHFFMTLCGAVLAATLHYTGAHTASQAIQQVAVFVMGWIAKNPGGVA